MFIVWYLYMISGLSECHHSPAAFIAFRVSHSTYMIHFRSLVPIRALEFNAEIVSVFSIDRLTQCPKLKP